MDSYFAVSKSAVLESGEESLCRHGQKHSRVFMALHISNYLLIALSAPKKYAWNKEQTIAMALHARTWDGPLTEDFPASPSILILISS